MKTSLPLFSIKQNWLLAVFFFVSALNSQAQADLSFTSYSLVSGTDRQPGATYRFTNVKPGVDAMVTYASSFNGAILDSVDQLSSGFLAGFQPLVRVPANTDGYLHFNISFVVANTNTSISIPSLTHTAIDIDGHQLAGDTLYEWEAVNMGGGTLLDYAIANPAISVSQQGNWVTGKNTEGVEYAGIDTAAKRAMFSVTKTNVSQYQIRFGADNRSNSSTARQRSSYFKKFTYPSGVLPVKLTLFTASWQNNKADLKWTTAGEINVSHFVIEKSTDGVSYNEAGIVFANGNASDKTNYSFSDNLNNMQSGIVYYRLRSVDIDGKSQYSETRIIRISKTTDNNITIQAYPNPVIIELRVTIPSNWQNKKVTYELFNANGQTTKRMEANSSSQTETLNVNSLSPGFYIVRVTCNGETAQQKIMKQ